MPSLLKNSLAFLEKEYKMWKVNMQMDWQMYNQTDGYKMIRRSLEKYGATFSFSFATLNFRLHIFVLRHRSSHFYSFAFTSLHFRLCNFFALKMRVRRSKWPNRNTIEKLRWAKMFYALLISSLHCNYLQQLSMLIW